MAAFPERRKHVTWYLKCMPLAGMGVVVGRYMHMYACIHLHMSSGGVARGDMHGCGRKS